MLDLLSQWVAHYGYLLVAVFLFVEGAGLPVPGETALLSAAALAGRGTLSLVGVVLAGCIGTFLGLSTGYWIGWRGGTALVARHGRWIGLNEDRLAKTHRFFEKHGAKTVLLGRFVAFIRSFIGIFAGISRMSLRTFSVYNVIGGCVWVTVFSALGYLFGRNLPKLVHYIGRVSLLLAILVALAVGVVYGWRWLARNRETVRGWSVRLREWSTESPRISGLRERHPVVAGLIGGRFARGEYLTMHLLVGFVASLAVIGVFASITESIVDSSPLTRFDLAVATRLESVVTPNVARVLAVVSSFGGRGAMTVLLIAGALIYAMRGRWLALATWCAAFIGGSLLDATLRSVVRRSELPFADLIVIHWGTGLASGHVLGVVVGYGMLAYLLASLARRVSARWVIAVAAIAVVAAITIARFYLGQHYVSDASAGIAAGLLWLTACVSASEIVGD